jgi:hypothetical protein
MELNLGPISFRAFSENGWTSYQLGFTTNANGGAAMRETAIKTSFKSDHLTELLGKDNQADTFEDPETGTLFFGKFCQTPTGTFYLTAKAVYTKALYQRITQTGLQEAERATTGEPAPQAQAPAKPRTKRTAKSAATTSTAPAKKAAGETTKATKPGDQPVAAA